MLARWTVQYGPEFAASKAQIARKKATPARLDLHLSAVRIDLERDPFRYSWPYFDDSRRVIETRDRFGDSFILTAFVTVDPSRFACTIEWIEMRALDDEDEDEEEEAEEVGGGF